MHVQTRSATTTTTSEFADVLNHDYGERTGLCGERAPESGVFRREWARATVDIYCSTDDHDERRLMMNAAARSTILV